MIRSLLSTVLFCLLLTACAQDKKGEQVVTIKTSFGDMVAILYNETPRHKENMIKLINQKFTIVFSFIV